MNLEAKETLFIRKLGLDESFYDHIIKNQKEIILPRVFLTTVEKSVKINLKILIDAAVYWTKRHPLLQSNILCKIDEETNKCLVQSSKYFVYLKDGLGQFHNICLTETYDPFEWKNIVEEELKTNFDDFRKPLWRMKVIHFKNENAIYNYAFMFNCHHSIGDGRNFYTIVYQYIKIVNALCQGKIIEEMNGEIEHPQKTMEDFIAEMKANPNYKSEIKEMPNFNQDKDIIPHEIGDRINGKPGNFAYLLLNSERLKKIFNSRDKYAPKARMSAILYTLTSLCIRKLYKEYNVDFSKGSYDHIQFHVVASLRSKFNLNNSLMGVYSTFLNFMIDDSLTDENFWTFVEESSIDLHDRIANNEDLEMLDSSEERLNKINFVDKWTNNYNFLFSNIGVMPNLEEGSAIQIKEHYVAIPCQDGNSLGSTLFLGMTTVNDQLSWSFSYNDKFYSKEFISRLHSLILNFIDNLSS